MTNPIGNGEVRRREARLAAGAAREDGLKEMWSAFVFRTAVNPSVEAPGETSCFARSGKQTSLHFVGSRDDA
jgi:hypothetical protein